MPRLFDRREFVQSVVTGVAGLSMIGCDGCEKVLQDIANRPIRRSLATLAANDPIITAYRAAVVAMRALPAGDPRNWTKQAQIHFDFCPHGNWFFLPWHRAYLTYFEQICRKLLGQDDFALPYWDWTADAHIHPAFWGDPAVNALMHAARGSFTSSSVISPETVGRPVVDSILDEPDFLTFASGQSTVQRPNTPRVYGRLEGTPHNAVHSQIQGTMGGFHSPLDPIFWTHHNMIECLWIEWNSRGNANTSDTTWLDYVFSGNFVDRDGNAANPSVAVTALMPLLSYRYDGLCGGVAVQSMRQRLQVDSTAFRRVLTAVGPPKLNVIRRFPGPAPLQLGLRQAAAQAIATDAAALEGFFSATGSGRLLLNVAEVELPPATPDLFVRVFVGSTNAGPTTPLEDPHYAGSFAFFNDPAHPAGTGSFVVDVSAALRRLSQAGSLPSRARIPIQLVAVPFPGREPTAAPLTVRRLELALAR
jgi:tyrosinase